MKVVNIAAGRVDTATVETLTELLALAKAGDLISLGYIAEVRGVEHSLFAVLGKYLHDPFHGMTAVTRLWFKLSGVAESREREHAPEKPPRADRGL